ncbi:hypothetical protein ACHQM5_012289 [Ranunculus cassubicifolius]
MKSLQSLHVFPPTNSMKIKSLVQSHIFQQIWQVLRAFTKMKTLVLQLLSNKDTCKKNANKRYLETIKKIKAKKNKKKFFSSITMHYNWCSNYVMPMPEEEHVDGCRTRHDDYYDSTWNAGIPVEENCQEGLKSQLSGYLQWLDEKVPTDNCTDEEVDEIDKLADEFIASCHEKFRLEKQESLRRYQEMLARSM